VYPVTKDHAPGCPGGFTRTTSRGWRNPFPKAPGSPATAQGRSCRGQCPRGSQEKESGRRAGTPACHPPEDEGSSSSVAQHVLGVKRNFPNYDHIWFCSCGGRGRQPPFSLRASAPRAGHPVPSAPGRPLALLSQLLLTQEQDPRPLPPQRGCTLVSAGPPCSWSGGQHLRTGSPSRLARSHLHTPSAAAGTAGSGLAIPLARSFGRAKGPALCELPRRRAGSPGSAGRPSPGSRPGSSVCCCCRCSGCGSSCGCCTPRCFCSFWNTNQGSAQLPRPERSRGFGGAGRSSVPGPAGSKPRAASARYRCVGAARLVAATHGCLRHGDKNGARSPPGSSSGHRSPSAGGRGVPRPAAPCPRRPSPGPRCRPRGRPPPAAPARGPAGAAPRCGQPAPRGRAGPGTATRTRGWVTPGGQATGYSGLGPPPHATPCWGPTVPSATPPCPRSPQRRAGTPQGSATHLVKRGPGRSSPGDDSFRRLPQVLREGS